MFNISKSVCYSIMTQHLCSKPHYNLIICSHFIWLVSVKMYPLRYFSFFLLTFHTKEIHHIKIITYHNVSYYPLKFIKKQFVFHSYLFYTILPAFSLLLLIDILESTDSNKNTFAISSFPENHRFHSGFRSEIPSDWIVLNTHAAALSWPADCCF